MKSILPLIMILSIFSWACKSSKYTPMDFPDRQIIFGSGGGFTGKYETYTLLENGQLFYKNSITEEISEVSNVGKKTAKSFLKQMEEMDFKGNAVESPGNFNYFINLKEGEEIHACKWAEDATVDARFKDIHKALMNLTKALD